MSTELLTLPTSAIWIDEEFNCRGGVSRGSVENLVLEIQESDYVEPLGVQPIDEIRGPNDELLRDYAPAGYTHRVLTGHRRLTACNVLERPEVDAVVYFGLTYDQAHKINFGANAARKDLDIMQEAEWIRRTWPDDSGREIARKLNKPLIWVQRRLHLLDLPDPCQKAAADGRLSQRMIETLYKLPARDRLQYWTDHEQSIKERLAVCDRRPRSRKNRSQEETQAMIERLSDLGYNEIIPMLWVVGLKTDDELIEYAKTRATV